MITEILLTWAGKLLAGTLIGALVGAAGSMLLFLVMNQCGAWLHPRISGAWKKTALFLVGIFFLCIGILSGSTWGFSRAAEEQLLAAKISDTPALTKSFAPISSVATEWIGSTLLMAQNPQWMQLFNDSKQLPEAASAAITAFENGSQQIDVRNLATQLDRLSNRGLEQLFPMIEARWLTANSELFSSPIYDRFRPHLIEIMINLFNKKEEVGGKIQPSWMIDSLERAAKLDYNLNLSIRELGTAIQSDGFQNLFCRPLATLLAAQRWFFCVLLVVSLAIPPIGFSLLRKFFRPQSLQ